MNVYDSESIARVLYPMGFEQTSSLEAADMVIVNTCAIRGKAEQKAFSFLGRLADLKRKNPGLIIGVGGCVAQQEGRRILGRMPHIDFVFGTRAIIRLPEIVNRIVKDGERIVDIDMMDNVPEFQLSEDFKDTNASEISKFVTIMRGCDNYCAYCVVPYVRGREISRRPESIIKEIEELVTSGVKEVTLLGQNVNSYGLKEGLCSFSELLAQVNDIKGLKRIRFTTSHPKDLSEELICTFRNLDKLCKHIHLPVQSGSNRILKLMNRKYTREQYLEKTDNLRVACPEIAITSDIIVGFPGEQNQDFEDTMDLLKSIRYDSLYAFKYSDRPNAPAARLPEKISESEKQNRLAQVLRLQKDITIEKNLVLIDSVQVVLVDGFSKKSRNSEIRQWSGRNATHNIVNFTCNNHNSDPGEGLIGELIQVRIDEVLPNSLCGRMTQTLRTASVSVHK